MIFASSATAALGSRETLNLVCFPQLIAFEIQNALICLQLMRVRFIHAFDKRSYIPCVASVFSCHEYMTGDLFDFANAAYLRGYSLIWSSYAVEFSLIGE